MVTEAAAILKRLKLLSTLAIAADDGKR